MKKLTSQQIRDEFNRFFQSKGHQPVASSSLVPHNDPTLLFTNAGMVQFKETFLGQEKRNYDKAVTIQRCVRAGGKHNDLENVGYTARHHTFFEMMGNFSFGDYFKTTAIEYAWAFLTDVLGLPKEKLWISVYEKDDEAAQIWMDTIGIPKDRISYCGAKDNFWQMGDTGPCGPCTEIFYDHGNHIPGGPPGSPEEDGDRYIEIWNLVFMQYDRDASGALNPLPKPSVDTGMGLERLAAVLQGVTNNYDIDSFQYLTRKTAAIIGVADTQQSGIRVIADHIRSCAFMIVDGIIPSNEGQGYVLRRIIRRAIRHGYKLGKNDVFFHLLVQPLVDIMGKAYPELVAQQEKVEKLLLKESLRFMETLQQGMAILKTTLDGLATGNSTQIPGDIAFKLYDTYGFPVDLTADIAREHELSVDFDTFDELMEQQRQRARKAGKFTSTQNLDLQGLSATEFAGYEQDALDSAEVVRIFLDGQRVEQLEVGDTGSIILSKTPFYAESGGQVGDKGELQNDSVSFVVEDTHKQNDIHIHSGNVIDGKLQVGDKLRATIRTSSRRNHEKNHSATHLLHAALTQHLGSHIEQRGSLVDADKLRFDFSHDEAVNDATIDQIQNEVNLCIAQNLAVDTEVMPIETAKQRGATALFGEKYGDEVRVVSMGPTSMELCGGTHVQRTGDIGFFKILSEGSVAAGIRRIEAVTHQHAWDVVAKQSGLLKQISRTLKIKEEQVLDKTQQLMDKVREQEKIIKQLKTSSASQSNLSVDDHTQKVGNIHLIRMEIADSDPSSLRGQAEALRNKHPETIVLLTSVNDAKVTLIAASSKAICVQFPANELVQHIAKIINGRGGGKVDIAQGGGNDPTNLPQALESIEVWIQQRL